MNSCVLTGRLAKIPDFRKTQNGISTCRLRLAVKRGYSSNGKAVTDFLDVVTWRETADFVSQYLCIGQAVAVIGSVQPRKYTDHANNTRTVYEIVADRVEPFGSKSTSNSEISEQATEPEASSFIDITDDSDLPF